MVSDGEITRMTPEEIESCRRLREQVAAFCEEMRVREHTSQPPLHYDMGWNLFFSGPAQPFDYFDSSGCSVRGLHLGRLQGRAGAQDDNRNHSKAA
jgi:hypothetical protein